MYKEQGEEITKTEAGLMLSAILSDTLMFRSPTCTPVDKAAAEELAKIANVDIETHAKNMFRAGRDFASKTTEEIFYQDFKHFTVGDVKFGVGQINSMNSDELRELKERLEPFFKEVANTHRLDMVFFMLTNIIEESTELLCYGKGAKEQVIEAFDLPAETEDVRLAGVVSRKKQLIPAFVVSFQQ